MPLAIGSTLGPYEIIAPLGAGGMGEVYRARDTRLGRDIAIKALPPEFAHDAERSARFDREARLLASLNHPNIASIYGLEDAGGVRYLLLELVEGETLAARLSRGRMDLADTLSACGQIAAAIEAAHERGIVHRDLKPGNVMLAAGGAVKVLDFGLARAETAEAATQDLSQSPTIAAYAGATEAGMILGTAAYMSPEQARGKPVDRRSDVWSFGCVLYECLAGHATFSGETVSDLIARILEREPDWGALPDGTPARVREILRRCLRKDAEARPRDIRDVRLELLEIASSGARVETGRENSIAVLPFDNQSGPDDEYFADGVTDEILNALAQVEGLRVAARTSCFAFKGKREDLRGIGEKLDVTTVLEGTVRRSGSRLRITAQLVNVADGYQLWSERYDREMHDVFAVQDEIAAAIATRLRGTLNEAAQRGHARKGTQNLEAYELLLRGRALQSRRGRFLAEANACFERAIALDPNYAEAYAWLSDSYRLTGIFGGTPPAVVFPKARSMAERALALDASSAQAWATLASVEEQYERNYAAAALHYERALSVDPRHSQSRSQRALWGLTRGAVAPENAIADSERALQDDPLNAWLRAMHSFILGYAGRREEDIAVAEHAMTIDSESFFAHWNLLRAYSWAGQYARAFAIAPGLLGASGRNPWALAALAWLHSRSGARDTARAVYDELEARARHESISTMILAIAASSAGLAEEGLRLAERAATEHDPLVVWGRSNPFCDSLRDDPRFMTAMTGVWT